MKLKAVIFDLDGTLLDTIEDICDSLNEVIGIFDYPQITVEQCKRFVGDSFVKLIQRAIAPHSPDQDTQNNIFEKLNHHYRQNPKNKTKPYDGIDRVFEFLEQNNIPYAVATNKDQVSAQNILSQYMPNSKALIIKGVDPIKKIRKPDASFVDDIFTKFKEKDEGITKDNILFIGDSEVDNQTASNGGVKFLWVSWGFRNHEEMSDLNIPYKADSCLQLIDVLDKLR